MMIWVVQVTLLWKDKQTNEKLPGIQLLGHPLGLVPFFSIYKGINGLLHQVQVQIELSRLETRVAYQQRMRCTLHFYSYTLVVRCGFKLKAENNLQSFNTLVPDMGHPCVLTALCLPAETSLGPTRRTTSRLLLDTRNLMDSSAACKDDGDTINIRRPGTQNRENER